MTIMYDAVDLTQIPPNAPAVAGYVNGKWPTFKEIPTRFPHAKHLSIAVSADADADCLDVEKFDAVPAQAPAWVRRQKARGVNKPAVYCSVSDAKTVLDVLEASGIKRSEVRLWTAHYTSTPHRCSKACGFGMPTTADATQYTDRFHGKNLDASLLSETFFVTQAERRAVLRLWIIGQRAKRKTWAWLKSQPEWKLWRKLGGR